MERTKAYKHTSLIGLQMGETETKEQKRCKYKSVYTFTRISLNDTETNQNNRWRADRKAIQKRIKQTSSSPYGARNKEKSNRIQLLYRIQS